MSIAPEYEQWIALWDGLGAEQPPRCGAQFAGHPGFLGPVGCILDAGHVNADDDRHAGGDPLFRWSDADSALQLQVTRAREARLSALALGVLCVECGTPCRPVVRGCCGTCVAAGIGADQDDNHTADTLDGAA